MRREMSLFHKIKHIVKLESLKYEGQLNKIKHSQIEQKKKKYNLVHNKDRVSNKFSQDEFFSKWISDNYVSWGQKAIRVHLISYKKKKI